MTQLSNCCRFIFISCVFCKKYLLSIIIKRIDILNIASTFLHIKVTKECKHECSEIFTKQNIFYFQEIQTQCTTINNQLFINSMMYPIILTSLLVFCSYARIYNVGMNCGVCEATTGCLNNICLKFTGDITSQYCYDQPTCSFSVQQNIQLGICSTDQLGQSCPSKLCLLSSSTSMCYSANGYCLNGVQFTYTCSGGNYTITHSGGVFGSTPSVTSFDIGTCPFTYASGGYSTCSQDIYGGTCDCCYSINIQGLSMMTGSCVPQKSPIVKVKGQMSSGMHIYLSIIMALLVLMM